MRLTDEQIKDLLDHDDVRLRSYALRYFAESYSPDTTVIARVLAAIDRSGIEHMFERYHTFFIAQLAQSAESVAWAIRCLEERYLSVAKPAANPSATSQELAAVEPLDPHVLNAEICDDDEGVDDEDDDFDDDSFEEENNAFAPLPTREEVAWRIVEAADATLTLPYERTLFKICKQTGGPTLTTLRERWRLCESSFANLWSDLEHRVRKARKARKAGKWQSYPKYVEALARHPAEMLPRVLDYLQQALDSTDSDDHAFGMQATLVEIAGRARLNEAAELIAQTYMFDSEIDNENATDALIRIGTPAAVQAARRMILEKHAGALWYAQTVLGNIHSDEAVQAGLEWLLELDNSEQILERLADDLLAQPSTDIVEAVYALLKQNPSWYEAKKRFGVTCRIVGRDYPEIDAWMDEANARRSGETGSDGWSVDLQDFAAVLKALGVSDKVDPSLFSDGASDQALTFGSQTDLGSSTQLRNLELLQDVYTEEHPPEVDDSTWNPAPVRVAYTSNRNDPCPCGSGKKYKKCCLSKRS